MGSNLAIGQYIQFLRKQKHLSQKQLAEELGVSFQAVSKWETGDGDPDITMLPALSNYFGVTVDSLLGMNDIKKSERYEEINLIWAENDQNKLHHENVVLMRQALKDFPNNHLLLIQLSTSLEKLSGTIEERSRYLRESIAVQEQILRYGEESEVRSATRFNICFAYWKAGEYEKALEQAKRLPNLYKARENALIYFLKDEEKYKVSKEALAPIAWVIVHHLSALSETTNNQVHLNKASQILDILFDGENEDPFLKSLRERITE